MVASVLSSLSRDQIRYEPYPHVWTSDALPWALYDELDAAFPSMGTVVGDRVLENNKAYLMNAAEVIDNLSIPMIWRDFFNHHLSDAFFREMLRFWSVAIEREYPDIESLFGAPLDALTTGVRRRGVEKTAHNHSAHAMMDVQFGINSPVTRESRVRGPHIDKPFKLFAGLLYFRHRHDDTEGGELQLYRLRSGRYHVDNRFDTQDEFVEIFDAVPYRPNTFVTWLNTPRSLHGVSPRSVTQVPRRYVNFLVECYDVNDGRGFFEAPRPLSSRMTKILWRLAGRRDA